MTAKNIIAIVLAIIVGIVAIKIVFALLSIAFSLIGWAIGIAIAGGIIYLLYRVFSNMLGSGKRLTN